MGMLLLQQQARQKLVNSSMSVGLPLTKPHGLQHLLLTASAAPVWEPDGAPSSGCLCPWAL